MSGREDWTLAAVEPTLAFFTECFGRLSVEWCVAGAVAANAYRDPRATTDLDLVVQIHAAQFSDVAKDLKAAGWEMFRRSPESDYPDVVRLRHRIYSPTDLLLVKTAYQQEALVRSRSAGAVRILSPEDVVIHKLIAYRHRDRADVHEILRGGESLDRAYIERWSEFWDVLPRWKEALAEVD